MELFRFDNLSQAGANHFVTTRDGGVSQEPYNSLNLSHTVGDDPQAVQQNYQRLAEQIGILPRDFVFLKQLHGTHVHQASTADRGRGVSSAEDAIEGDALITNQPGVAITVKVADCIPILIYEPKKNVAAAIHAGWRGTAEGIAPKVIRRMADEFGAEPAEIVVGIGPSIGPCHYTKPQARGPLGQFMDGDNLDLWAANKAQLEDAGVASTNIEVSGICNYEQAHRFFSHRQSGGQTGRFAAGIVLA